MAVRLSKSFQPLSEALSHLKGQMGVYELADAQGNVVFVGVAGGKSLYGLKGEVSERSKSLPHAALVRVEVTTAYLSRYREVLMAHQADDGKLPPHEPELTLGRLSPS